MEKSDLARSMVVDKLVDVDGGRAAADVHRVEVVAQLRDHPHLIAQVLEVRRRALGVVGEAVERAVRAQPLAERDVHVEQVGSYRAPRRAADRRPMAPRVRYWSLVRRMTVVSMRSENMLVGTPLKVCGAAGLAVVQRPVSDVVSVEGSRRRISGGRLRTPWRPPLRSPAPIAVTLSTRPPAVTTWPSSRSAVPGVVDGHARKRRRGLDAADGLAALVLTGVATARDDHRDDHVATP